MEEIQVRCQKEVFTERVMRCWNKLPTEAVDAPCPEVFSQVGWGPGQPDLVLDLADGNPVCGSGGRN